MQVEEFNRMLETCIPRKMYQLDFEEFLIANDFGKDAIAYLRKSFEQKQPLAQEIHDKVLSLFKRYLLVGGMPDAVNEYLNSHNIVKCERFRKPSENCMVSMLPVTKRMLQKNCISAVSMI